MRKVLGIVSVLAVVLMLEENGWSQCAMCRSALENSAEGQAAAAGFRKGIVFLLAVPYAILGGIGFGVFRAYKKQAISTEE